jgi:hypothetical protein
MLRLELAAEVANLQAEAGVIAAEAALESGEPLDLPAVDAAAGLDTEPAADGDSPSTGAEPAG